MINPVFEWQKSIRIVAETFLEAGNFSFPFLFSVRLPPLVKYFFPYDQLCKQNVREFVGVHMNSTLWQSQVLRKHKFNVTVNSDLWKREIHRKPRPSCQRNAPEILSF